MNELTKKHFEIKDLIKKQSPFDNKETERILNKFFNSVPASVKILIKDYQFDKKTVLDIGCSYGQSLLYWGKDSEGIEVQEHMIRFVESLNKTVYELNVEEGFSSLKKENYDAIYSNNLIEHLVSPHLFLVRLHAILKPGGILAIGHPVVPLFGIFWKLLGYKGWLGVEHINFFTPKTARLTLERAGFRVEKQYFPRVKWLPPTLGIRVLFICKSIKGFKYSPKRLNKFNPSWYN